MVAYLTYQRKLRRAKAIERGMKMVPVLIHLPPPSADTQSGSRDLREVMREKTSQAEVLYNLIAGTATEGFKSKFYGQRHISLELVAADSLVHFYAAVPVALVSTVEKAIQTAYPGSRLEEVEDHNIFNQEGRLAATMGGEMVLRAQAAYPIATYAEIERDPMEAILTSLSTLSKDDGAAIQILVRPANPGWVKSSTSLTAKLRKGRAGGLSISPMDLAKAAYKSPQQQRSEDRERQPESVQLSNLELKIIEAVEGKTKNPGFEVLVRVLVSTESVAKSQQLLRDIATAFALFDRPGLNGFKFYPAADVQGIVTAFIFRFFPPELRQNVLNSEELATLFHLPDSQFVPTANVQRQQSKQVDGPVQLSHEGLLFGYNEFRGVKKEIRLSTQDRRRHTYILGQTGTGKSTMLENLAVQDMLNGNGFAFIDPHGDTAEKLLSMVPKNRAEDVIYFNPSDTEYPLGLNLFEFDDPAQKDFLVQETIGMLYKLYDPGHTGIIGPRYEHWYRNAALTLMSDPNGSTFIEVPKVFTDTDYLKQKFRYLKDPTVIDFWTKEMGQTSDYHKSEMLGWFVSKFGAFQNNEMMRNIIGQTKSAFNIRDVMDNKKILIVNLSKGRIGELNSQLLGMIFVIKFQAAAMSRADMPEDQRNDFSLYVDEFQNFATDSFASILSEARKYRLNLIVANQFIGQLSNEIRDAVFGNIGSIIAHRMGPEDAEFMVKQFAPMFDTTDLVNIPNYNAVMRLMIGGLPSQPFTLHNLPPIGAANNEMGLAIKQLSAAKFGLTKAMVEADITARLTGHEVGKPAPAPVLPEEAASEAVAAPVPASALPPLPEPAAIPEPIVSPAPMPASAPIMPSTPPSAPPASFVPDPAPVVTTAEPAPPSTDVASPVMPAPLPAIIAPMPPATPAPVAEPSAAPAPVVAALAMSDIQEEARARASRPEPPADLTPTVTSDPIIAVAPPIGAPPVELPVVPAGPIGGPTAAIANATRPTPALMQGLATAPPPIGAPPVDTITPPAEPVVEAAHTVGQSMQPVAPIITEDNDVLARLPELAVAAPPAPVDNNRLSIMDITGGRKLPVSDPLDVPLIPPGAPVPSVPAAPAAVPAPPPAPPRPHIPAYNPEADPMAAVPLVGAVAAAPEPAPVPLPEPAPVPVPLPRPAIMPLAAPAPIMVPEPARVADIAPIAAPPVAEPVGLPAPEPVVPPAPVEPLLATAPVASVLSQDTLASPPAMPPIGAPPIDLSLSGPIPTSAPASEPAPVAPSPAPEPEPEHEVMLAEPISTTDDAMGSLPDEPLIHFVDPSLETILERPYVDEPTPREPSALETPPAPAATASNPNIVAQAQAPVPAALPPAPAIVSTPLAPVVAETSVVDQPPAPIPPAPQSVEPKLVPESVTPVVPAPTEPLPAAMATTPPPIGAPPVDRVPAPVPTSAPVLTLEPTLPESTPVPALVSEPPPAPESESASVPELIPATAESFNLPEPSAAAVALAAADEPLGGSTPIPDGLVAPGATLPDAPAPAPEVSARPEEADPAKPADEESSLQAKDPSGGRSTEETLAAVMQAAAAREAGETAAAEVLPEPVPEPEVATEPKPNRELKASIEPETATNTVAQAEHKIDDVLSRSLIKTDKHKAEHRSADKQSSEEDARHWVGSALPTEVNDTNVVTDVAREVPHEQHSFTAVHHKVIEPLEPIIPRSEEIKAELARLEAEEAATSSQSRREDRRNRKKNAAERTKNQDNTGEKPAPIPEPAPTPVAKPEPIPVTDPRPVSEPTPELKPMPVPEIPAEPVVPTPAPESAPVMTAPVEEEVELPEAESLAADDVARVRAEQAAQQPPPAPLEAPAEETPAQPEESAAPAAEKAKEPEEEPKHSLIRRRHRVPEPETKPAETPDREEASQAPAEEAKPAPEHMTGKLIMPSKDHPKNSEVPVSTPAQKPPKLAPGEVFVDEQGNVIVGE